MKRLWMTAAAALMATTAFAVPAMAWEGTVQKCYNKVYVPAQFKTTRHKIKDAKSRYEYRGSHRVELVHYPAVYVERRHKVRDGHYVLQETACR